MTANITFSHLPNAITSESTYDQLNFHFQGRIWKTMELDTLFHQPNERVSFEKCREVTFLRAKRIVEYEFLTTDEQADNFLKTLELSVCIGMYDWALSNKISLHSGVSTGDIRKYESIEYIR